MERKNDPGEWAVAVLLSANLVWTSLCLGGVRAETMAWSGVLTCATAAVVAVRQLLRKSAGHWAPAWLLPFLLYALLSACALTPVRWIAIREWLLWMQIFLVFAIALNGLQSRGPRRLVLGAAMSLGVVALVLSAYQVNGHQGWLMLGRVQALQYVGRASGFLGNPNSLAALCVLLIPPMLALAWRRGASGVQRVAFGYVALAFIIGLALTLSRGGWLALTVALVFWPCFVAEWRWPRRVLTCVAVLSLVALAGAAIWTTMPSARERLEKLGRDHGEKSRVILWHASLKMAADSPATGTGAGSFNTVFEKYRPEGFLDDPQWTHNEFLNVLSDYGVAGFVLLFGGIGGIAWRSRRRGPRQPRHTLTDEMLAQTSFNRALGIGLFAFALACLVDFHMHIPALGMVVAIFAAELLKRRELPESHAAHAPHASHVGGGCVQTKRPEGPLLLFFPHAQGARMPVLRCVLTIVALALLAYVMAGANRAEAMRVAGREQIDALAGRNLEAAEYHQTLMRAGVLLANATLRDPGNAQAWSDIAYALALQARIEKQNAALLGKEAGEAARKAIGLAPDVPEFWIRLGVALDLQKRTVEAGAAFARALQLSPASPLAWYHLAYHLSLTPSTRNLALGAAGVCLRLDPGHLDADILRVQLQSRQ